MGGTFNTAHAQTMERLGFFLLSAYLHFPNPDKQSGINVFAGLQAAQRGVVWLTETHLHQLLFTRLDDKRTLNE